MGWVFQLCIVNHGVTGPAVDVFIDVRGALQIRRRANCEYARLIGERYILVAFEDACLMMYMLRFYGHAV